MGQVERYGVFALCVVIFLILGIAIWGGGAPAPVTPPASKEVAAAPKAAGKEGKDVNSALASETEQKELVDSRKDNKPSATFPRGELETVPEGGAQRPQVPAAEARTYRVKSGDTLARIAARELGSKSKVDAILAVNPGLDARKLQVNQEIKLPAASATRPATPDTRTDTKAPVRGEATAKDMVAKDAVVKDAHKATEVGKKTGEKADKNAAVAKGKDAHKPAEKSDKTDKAAWPKHYKVASGDKLAAIARRFYGDDKKVTMLAKANGIKDASRVRQGMMLTIPAAN